MPEHDEKQDLGSATKLAGLGVEFAGAVAVFCLVGWWLDRHWGIENHWGLIICAILGLIGGMYNLLRQALAWSREVNRPKQKPAPQDDVKGR